MGVVQRIERARAIPALPAWRSARIGLTPTQGLVVFLAASAAIGLTVAAPEAALALARFTLLCVFAAAIGLRILHLNAPAAEARPELAPRQGLPLYTVVCALYREADMAPRLLDALGRLDYPKSRLQVLFALEADDAETRDALMAAGLPAWARIVTAQGPGPRTKPRALNAALAEARGEFLVVYDAEDRPDPAQLREAVARFRADPATACLQAPLRISAAPGLLARQFALEYAVHFELAQRWWAARAPFALGGTSNHFRVAALRAVGGWDAWNVTEDADLGFRLGAAGLGLGVLSSPTWETPSRFWSQWLPQRTRWLKGFIQTTAVHTRAGASGARGLAALAAGPGLAVLSALAFAPSVAIVLFGLASAGADPDLALFAAGWAVAAIGARHGAKRAGVPFRWTDAALLPAYWTLAFPAACRALWQLATRPHHWDKTDHPLETAHGEAGRLAA